MVIIAIYDVEVYIDGLCVGGAKDGTLCVGDSLSVKELNVKTYPIYQEKIWMIDTGAVITYKRKRKKYAVNGVLRQTCLNVDQYGQITAELEFSL